MDSSHSWVTAMRTACNLSLAEAFSCACFVQISFIMVDNDDDEKVVRLLFSTLSDPLVMLAKLLSTELLSAFKFNELCVLVQNELKVLKLFSFLEHR
uniref:Uncharacterized protein n=1 Tax=Glossina palpalis gambiensis TaxID=67801 RepID=A0A1B0BA68_9MUSC